MKGASLIAPFGLRMPEDLKDKISERAKANGRSMNAEIVQILQDALDANEKKVTISLTNLPDAEGYKDENSPEFKAAVKLARVIMLEADKYIKDNKKPT